MTSASGGWTPRFPVDPNVFAEPCRVQTLPACVAQLVTERHGAACGFDHLSTNQHFVVIVVRHAIPAGDLRDHEDQPSILDFPVGEAGGPAKIGASDFEPDDVVRVVDDPHLIGFLVAHARPAVDKSGHDGNLTRPLFCSSW